MAWLVDNAEFVRHARNAARRHKLILYYTGYTVLWIVALVVHVAAIVYMERTRPLYPAESILPNAYRQSVRLVFLEMGIIHVGRFRPGQLGGF